MKCAKCMDGYSGEQCDQEALCWRDDLAQSEDQMCAQSAKCLEWTGWPNVDFTANAFACEACQEGNERGRGNARLRLLASGSLRKRLRKTRIFEQFRGNESVSLVLDLE